MTVALGTIARRLFRYGRTAPPTPRTTPTRRSHHPSPGPQDHVIPGDGSADPQKPPTGKVPMSWLTPTVRLKDQNGWTRDTNVKRIARPIMKKDDSTRRNSWSFVRKRGTRRIVPRNEGLG